MSKLTLAPRMDTTLAGGDTFGLQGLFDLSRSSFSGRQLETTLLGTPTASPDARWRGVYDTCSEQVHPDPPAYATEQRPGAHCFMIRF